MASDRLCFRLRAGLSLFLIACCLSGCTWLRQCIGSSPEKSHRLAEQARSAEEAGQIEQAVAYFEAALEETPDDPHLHRELAQLMLRLQNPQAALEHLAHAVEYNPDDVEANVELAKLYIEHNQAQPAANHLDAALQSDPKHITALVLRAKLAEYQQDIPMAIETYHRVLCSDPGHIEARLRIAALQIENDRPSLAAPLLRSICQCPRATTTDIAAARWKLGVAYGQERRWPDAVAALRSAAEHREDMTADDWYRLAYARSQSGDWRGARQDLDRALHMNPRHENAQAMLDILKTHRDETDTPILRIGHTVKPVPVPERW